MHGKFFHAPILYPLRFHPHRTGDDQYPVPSSRLPLGQRNDMQTRLHALVPPLPKADLVASVSGASVHGFPRTSSAHLTALRGGPKLCTTTEGKPTCIQAVREHVPLREVVRCV